MKKTSFFKLPSGKHEESIDCKTTADCVSDGSDLMQWTMVSGAGDFVGESAVTQPQYINGMNDLDLKFNCFQVNSENCDKTPSDENSACLPCFAGIDVGQVPVGQCIAPQENFGNHVVCLQRCQVCREYCMHPDDPEQSYAHMLECLSKTENLNFVTTFGTWPHIICPHPGPCPYGRYCNFLIHLECCRMCDLYCLNPYDEQQRREHMRECLARHERDMDYSFAMAQSLDKVCGICMEVVVKKRGKEKRFGIMSNCAHIYCLVCIRQWRNTKTFGSKLTRKCPQCRIISDYICPSAVWVETKEEREKLLTDYLAALKMKDCKYFKKGDGRCPFGNKCFYKHENSQGQLVDVGSVKRKPKRRRTINLSVSLGDLLTESSV